MRTVSFTKMENGTVEEFSFLSTLYEKCRKNVPDHVIGFAQANARGSNGIPGRP